MAVVVSNDYTYFDNFRQRLVGTSLRAAIDRYYQPGEVVFNRDQTVRIRGILHHYNHLLAELSNGGEHAED